MYSSEIKLYKRFKIYHFRQKAILLMEVNNQIQKLKIITLGDQKVGKTAIIKYYIQQVFYEQYKATVGIDFISKNLTVNGRTARVQLWDTAGQERFRSLIPSYIRDSIGTLIVADLTNISSINKISKWVDQARQQTKIPTTIIVLGNKSDLDTDFKGASLARSITQSLGLIYRSVSAKTGENIQEVFNQLVGLIFAQKYQEKAGPIQSFYTVKQPQIKPDLNIYNPPKQQVNPLKQQVAKSDAHLQNRVTYLEWKVKELQNRVNQMWNQKNQKLQEKKKLGKNFEEVLMLEAIKQAIKTCNKFPCPCFRKKPLQIENSWQIFGQWAIVQKYSCDSCIQILKEYTIKYCDEKVKQSNQ